MMQVLSYYLIQISLNRNRKATGKQSLFSVALPAGKAPRGDPQDPDR